MDFRKILESGHNKTINKEIIDYIGNSELRFNKLLDCFFSNEMRLSQRASWALGDVSLKHPTLFNKHHRKLIDSLKVKQYHNAIRRNVVRTYQFAEIPEEYEAELYDICLNFISDTQEKTAVKAFSLRVCERIIEKYPEMAGEMLALIRANKSLWSSGLKNRGQKFLERWG